MAVLYTQHFVQFFDSNGDPLSNGKLYAYAAGTTTPKATYTDEGATTQHSHPIDLDSAGRATVFIEGSYRFDLFDQNDVLIKSTDDVTSFTTLNESGQPFFQSFSGNGEQTVFTLSEPLGSDSKDIMVFVDNGRPNYVVNGDFATDTIWTKGSGWTIGSGVATATGAISTALTQTSDVALVENQVYTLTYTVTRSAGGIIPSVGGKNGTERTASGTYTETIIAGATQAIAFTGNGFTGTLDNIIIKLVGLTGYEIQNPSAYTLSGTSLTFNIAPDVGTGNIYVYAPTKLLGAASASASAAAASASAAAASAAAAAAASLVITSSSSVAIGTGSKTFSTFSSLPIQEGQWLIVSSDANPVTNYMTGQITSYTGSTLIINITQAFGSGTLSDWSMKLSGVEGEAGAAGATGSVSATTAVVAATTSGASLQSSNNNDCITWGVGGTANVALNADLSGASTYKGINFVDPTSAQDLATKNYVDALVLADTPVRLVANLSGGSPSISAERGVDTVTKTGSGRYRVNFDDNFANTNYIVKMSANSSFGVDGSVICTIEAVNVGYVDVFFVENTGDTDSVNVLKDPSIFHLEVSVI
jgi:hypothetical protein